MTLLISVIAGSVLALQTADKFAMTGADNYVGGLVALAIIREMGPIFACLTVGARSTPGGTYRSARSTTPSSIVTSGGTLTLGALTDGQIGTDTDLCAEGTYICSGGSQTCTDATGNIAHSRRDFVSFLHALVGSPVSI